jgi:hypothetical protein
MGIAFFAPIGLLLGLAAAIVAIALCRHEPQRSRKRTDTLDCCFSAAEARGENAMPEGRYQ